MTPLISIIVPAYNSEKYIGDCLNSFIAQTYQNWEAIVIVAPSTDNTINILKKYSIESRIKIIQEKTKTNCATARNIGYNNSSGKYIYFNDSDDWIEPDCLKIMIEKLENNTCLSWCVNYQVTHLNGEKHIIDLIPGTHHNIGGIGGILFRRDCLEKIKNKSGHLFDEKLNHTDDADLVLRARHYPHMLIPMVLSNYRWNTEGLTANTNWIEQEIGLLKILIKNNAWDLIPGNIMNFCIVLINETFGIDCVKIKKETFK